MANGEQECEFEDLFGFAELVGEFKRADCTSCENTNKKSSKSEQEIIGELTKGQATRDHVPGRRDVNEITVPVFNKFGVKKYKTLARQKADDDGDDFMPRNILNETSERESPSFVEQRKENIVVDTKENCVKVEKHKLNRKRLKENVKVQEGSVDIFNEQKHVMKFNRKQEQLNKKQKVMNKSDTGSKGTAEIEFSGSSIIEYSDGSNINSKDKEMGDEVKTENFNQRNNSHNKNSSKSSADFKDKIMRVCAVKDRKRHSEVENKQFNKSNLNKHKQRMSSNVALEHSFVENTNNQNTSENTILNLKQILDQKHKIGEMVYNDDITVRKSCRLKSAKCSSRYRGDYGLCADTYTKLVALKTSTCTSIDNKIPSVQRCEHNFDSTNDVMKVGRYTNEGCTSFCKSEVLDSHPKISESHRNVFENLLHSSHLQSATKLTKELTTQLASVELHSKICNKVNVNDGSCISDKDVSSKYSELVLSHCSGSTMPICNVVNKNCNFDAENVDGAAGNELVSKCSVCSVGILWEKMEIEPSARVPSCCSDFDLYLCTNCDKKVKLVMPEEYASKIDSSKFGKDSASEICTNPDVLHASVQIHEKLASLLSNETETDEDCKEHVGYVHAVGKSVHKKPYRVSERKRCSVLDVQVNSDLISYEQSPEGHDNPLKVLENLRQQLFEKAGASINQADQKSKHFESRLISSKLKKDMTQDTLKTISDSSARYYNVIENSSACSDIGKSSVLSDTRQSSAFSDIGKNSACSDIGKSSFHSELGQSSAHSDDYSQSSVMSTLRCSEPQSDLNHEIEEESVTPLDSIEKNKKSSVRATKQKRTKLEKKSFLLQSLNKIDTKSINVNDISTCFGINQVNDCVKETSQNEIKSMCGNISKVKNHERCHNQNSVSKRKELTAKAYGSVLEECKMENKNEQRNLKVISCQACGGLFKTKELLHKHYPCRVHQTRTWSQNKMPSNHAVKKTKTKQFVCQLPKSRKQNAAKQRPHLLTFRKTKFRRVKGKRRRKLYHVLQDLRQKRKPVYWPHLSILFDDLSFKEQCLYKLGLMRIDNVSEGLHTCNYEEIAMFEHQKAREKLGNDNIAVNSENFTGTNCQKSEFLSTVKQSSALSHVSMCFDGNRYNDNKADNTLNSMSSSFVFDNYLQENFKCLENNCDIGDPNVEIVGCSFTVSAASDEIISVPGCDVLTDNAVKTNGMLNDTVFIDKKVVICDQDIIKISQEIAKDSKIYTEDIFPGQENYSDYRKENDAKVVENNSGNKHTNVSYSNECCRQISGIEEAFVLIETEPNLNTSQNENMTSTVIKLIDDCNKIGVCLIQDVCDKDEASMHQAADKVVVSDFMFSKQAHESVNCIGHSKEPVIAVQKSISRALEDDLKAITSEQGVNRIKSQSSKQTEAFDGYNINATLDIIECNSENRKTKLLDHSNGKSVMEVYYETPSSSSNIKESFAFVYDVVNDVIQAPIETNTHDTFFNETNRVHIFKKTDTDKEHNDKFSGKYTDHKKLSSHDVKDLIRNPIQALNDDCCTESNTLKTEQVHILKNTDTNKGQSEKLSGKYTVENATEIEVPIKLLRDITDITTDLLANIIEDVSSDKQLNAVFATQHFCGNECAENNVESSCCQSLEPSVNKICGAINEQLVEETMLQNSTNATKYEGEYNVVTLQEVESALQYVKQMSWKKKERPSKQKSASLMKSSENFGNQIIDVQPSLKYADASNTEIDLNEKNTHSPSFESKFLMADDDFCMQILEAVKIIESIAEDQRNHFKGLEKIPDNDFQSSSETLSDDADQTCPKHKLLHEQTLHGKIHCKDMSFFLMEDRQVNAFGESPFETDVNCKIYKGQNSSKHPELAVLVNTKENNEHIWTEDSQKLENVNHRNTEELTSKQFNVLNGNDKMSVNISERNGEDLPSEQLTVLNEDGKMSVEMSDRNGEDLPSEQLTVLNEDGKLSVEMRDRNGDLPSLQLTVPHEDVEMLVKIGERNNKELEHVTILEQNGCKKSHSVINGQFICGATEYRENQTLDINVDRQHVEFSESHSEAIVVLHTDIISNRNPAIETNSNIQDINIQVAQQLNVNITEDIKFDINPAEPVDISMCSEISDDAREEYISGFKMETNESTENFKTIGGQMEEANIDKCSSTNFSRWPLCNLDKNIFDDNHINAHRSSVHILDNLSEFRDVIGKDIKDMSKPELNIYTKIQESENDFTIRYEMNGLVVKENVLTGEKSFIQNISVFNNESKVENASETDEADMASSVLEIDSNLNISENKVTGTDINIVNSECNNDHSILYDSSFNCPDKMDSLNNKLENDNNFMDDCKTSSSKSVDIHINTLQVTHEPDEDYISEELEHLDQCALGKNELKKIGNILPHMEEMLDTDKISPSYDTSIEVEAVEDMRKADDEFNDDDDYYLKSDDIEMPDIMSEDLSDLQCDDFDIDTSGLPMVQFVEIKATPRHSEIPSPQIASSLIASPSISLSPIPSPQISLSPIASSPVASYSIVFSSIAVTPVYSPPIASISSTPISSPLITSHSFASPPILEKMGVDFKCVEFLDKATSQEKEFCGGSEPPSLEPVSVQSVYSEKKSLLCYGKDSDTNNFVLKKQKSERHFLDVLGLSRREQGIELKNCVQSGEKINSDRMKPFSESVSVATKSNKTDHIQIIDESFGRHFSDFMSGSFVDINSQSSKLPCPGDGRDSDEITLAKLKEMLSPAARRKLSVSKESLMKIKSGIDKLSTIVKTPAKKDPSWLKRDALTKYSNTHQLASVKRELFDPLGDRDDFQDEPIDDSVLEECAESKNNKMCKSINLVSEELSTKCSKGSIAENILQMLTTLEDKGNIADNLSNLLAILAENLGFLGSNIKTDDESMCGCNSNSSDSNSSQSDYQKYLLSMENNFSQKLTKTQFSFHDFDEPPSLDEIPCAIDYNFPEKSPWNLTNFSPTKVCYNSESTPQHALMMQEKCVSFTEPENEKLLYYVDDIDTDSVITSVNALSNNMVSNDNGRTPDYSTFQSQDDVFRTEQNIN